MKNKKIDVQALCIYIAMFILVLFIILPPIFRVALGEKLPSEPTREPLTALICRNEFALDQTQYNISVNSTYKEELERVTFTYQIIPIVQTEPLPTEGEDTTVTPEVPTTPETPTVEDPTTQPVQDPNVSPQITADQVQAELSLLKSIPGIEVEDGENQTRLVLTKEAASAFDENSPYKSYFQGIEEQQVYFESLGYTCSVMNS